jgi:aromatic-L-amino-acid decarboxylase
VGVVDDTPLPVVWCVGGSAVGNQANEFHETVAAQVVGRGRGWISTTTVARRTALRACITSYRTGKEDLEALVESLEGRGQPPFLRASEP